MPWVVEFHADGGETCVQGVRNFGDDEMRAEAFEKMMRTEPGHTCERIARERGTSTVRRFFTEEDVSDSGAVYPALAGGNGDGTSRLSIREKEHLQDIRVLTVIDPGNPSVAEPLPAPSPRFISRLRNLFHPKASPG